MIAPSDHITSFAIRTPAITRAASTAVTPVVAGFKSMRVAVFTHISALYRKVEHREPEGMSRVWSPSSQSLPSSTDSRGQLAGA
jgi:hypothetical protein